MQSWVFNNSTTMTYINFYAVENGEDVVVDVFIHAKNDDEIDDFVIKFAKFVNSTSEKINPRDFLANYKFTCEMPKDWHKQGVQIVHFEIDNHTFGYEGPYDWVYWGAIDKFQI